MKREEQKEISTDIILKNQLMMNDMLKINTEFELENNRKKKYFIETYGCQMNEHDSEKLSAMLMQMGFETSPFRDDADLIIFNTCCVRENAELKVYGNLGHLKALKKKKPDLLIVVSGCMMQQPHVVEEIMSRYKHVDLVFGTHNVHNFPMLLAQITGEHNMVVEVWESEGEVIEGLAVDRRYTTKAFVNIMYGCNNFCTYCIVPYTRGRERSRTQESIIGEIKELVTMGTKEITLLGQNVNSYGKTLEEKCDFSDLLMAVNEIEGIERIRFMTSHPKDISRKLIDTMVSCEKVCDQLHLPVQAGSNSLLKAMNRNYTVESYLEMIDYAKLKLPNLGVSTDLIIGFPGETDEDIDATIELIKKVDYTTAFTYIYSIRKGTPAAEMDNQIPDDIKHERFQRILTALNDGVKLKMESFRDQTIDVLVESISTKNKDVLFGRSSQNITVNFPGDDALIGTVVNVKITKPKTFSLYGEVVE